MTLGTEDTPAVDWISARHHGARGDGDADDTQALQAALDAAAPGQVVYLPAGRYLLDSAGLRAAATGVTVRGAGPRATTLVIGSSFSGDAALTLGAAYCGVMDLGFTGGSPEIVSNSPCDAIGLRGGRFCRVDNVFAEHVNGWVVSSAATGKDAGFASMLSRISGLWCAGGIRIASSAEITFGAQHFLSNLNFQQIGVGGGPNANLDALRFEDCWDVTAENLNAAVSQAGGGSAINVVGRCATLYFTNYDLGVFPNSASGRNAVIRIQDGASGSPTDVRFVQGVAQQGRYGLHITGGARNIWFTSARFFNNYGHGAHVASTGSQVRFGHCAFAMNGRGAGGDSYDLLWTGAASGKVLGCEFSSAVGSPGVLGPMDFTGAGSVTVAECDCTGHGVTASNVFGTPPRYTHRTAPWNPRGAVSIAVPASGEATSVRPFDMHLYITTGPGGLACQVASGPVVEIPGKSFGTVFVPAGQRLAVRYRSAPTWVAHGS